jgi:hypothetical protein
VPQTIHNGIALTKLKKLLVAAGGVVENVERTGEVRFRHPLMARPSSRINNRRSDAPRHAVNFVREVLRLVEERDERGP